MTVVADKKQTSDVGKAVEYMEAYAEASKREAEAKAEKKALAEEMLRLAEKNMADWFPDSKKTYHLPNGKLSFEAKSELVFGEDFKFKVFQRHFPHLITIDPKKVITIGKVRTYLESPNNTKAQTEALEGLSIETVDKFGVTPL